MPLRIGYLLVLCFFCCLAYSQVPLSTVLSLAPPPTDGSLVYLANIFGTVDGVLSSSGSQVFGHLMGVFNLTVLALGSIVIMYTLIVGTLNTAHEGEFLGKHWSSIWLPVRATIGMTLLVPKTSGFCLMQIIVMWVVVQGVGAADKVWNEALDYMNMGGQLIAKQSSSETIYSINSASNPAYNGATALLTGQVCAYMMQKQFEKLREEYLSLANPDDNAVPSGPCAPTASKTPSMKDFCDNPVPDFLSGLNAVQFVSNNTKTTTRSTMPIPNFDTNAFPSFYVALSEKSICGSVSWENMKSTSEQVQDFLKLTDSQAESITKSRAIAIQQMIEFLQPVARAMVDNDPVINKNLSSADTATSVAFSQYGIAMNNDGAPCNKQGGCYTWGTDINKYSVLFAGNEFYNALNAYAGVMEPMLNLKNEKSLSDAKKFIQGAKQQGWIYAGGYFFQLVRLSGNPVHSATIDSDSGLEDSSLPALKACADTDTDEDSSILCQTFGTPTANTIIDNISNIIYGAAVSPKAVSSPCTGGMKYDYKKKVTAYGYVSVDASYSGNIHNFQNINCSSTTLGFIGNTFFLSNPGQPDMKIPPLIFPEFHPYTPIKSPKFKKPKCRMKPFCPGIIAEGIQSVISYILSFVIQAIWYAIVTFLASAIEGMLGNIWQAFSVALDQLRDMSLNPIVNLANVGAVFIQSGGEIIVLIVIAGAIAMMNVYAAAAMGFILAVSLPFVLVWVIFFFTIGFVAAYYIPLYPYMIFLFGTIAWLMSVIEAMVAAPIVALGIMSPEGEGILGKSETGMMILVNVFLRPSMMIIGFIMAIVLTYVAVWILNFQYDIVAKYLLVYSSNGSVAAQAGVNFTTNFFAQVFGFGSYISIYVSIYMTVAQKSFGLIFQLPDKVLRWIGAQQESFGQEVQHWADEPKQKTEQIGGQVEQKMGTAVSALKENMGGEKGQEGKQSGSVGGGGGSGPGAG